MLPYSFEALSSELEGFLHTVSLTSATYSLAFKVQYVTGCRFNELRQINRFAIVDASQYSLQPQKGNNLRVLPSALLPSAFLTMIQSQDTYFEGLTQSTASYYFRTFYFNKRIFHDNKQLTTNLFRHFYCKLLHSQDLSDGEIAANLGEVVVANAQNYIYSDLMYEVRDS